VRRHDWELGRAAETLRVPPERVADTVVEMRNRIRELERAARQGGAQGGVDVDQLAASAEELHGVQVLVSDVKVPDGKALLDVADRLKNKLGDAVIVLAAAGEDRVDLVASVAQSLVSRGLRAGELVKAAAAAVGGGGGGRDTLARAGGRDVEKLPEALKAARSAIESALAG
jgi:alanyl-tRNA synthetase